MYLIYKSLIVLVVVVVVVWELEVASAEEAEGAACLSGGPNGRGEPKGDGGPGDHGLHISFAQLILNSSKIGFKKKLNLKECETIRLQIENISTELNLICNMDCCIIK